MRLFRPDQRTGQRNRLRVPVPGERFNRGSAGKAELEQLGRLVERLAGRIVDGGRQPPIVADPADLQ
jgi:hypothetical protein